ncbi:unnamed protein product [Danaus chrysippus]|uniref:(African queen) hypothetical protein n=1 Tax=Danaus chrysippus TaxID=151541 RepID=A0A8J2QRB7_9NEOP|nr:unnamed protein product [Danaus chrysippus]
MSPTSPVALDDACNRASQEGASHLAGCVRLRVPYYPLTQLSSYYLPVDTDSSLVTYTLCTAAGREGSAHLAAAAATRISRAASLERMREHAHT